MKRISSSNDVFSYYKKENNIIPPPPTEKKICLVSDFCRPINGEIRLKDYV